MKLLDVVARVSRLTENAPYAVIGGLAQILWARKTHTDDLDVALTARDLARAYERARSRQTPRGWALPKAPDVAHEQDDVFEVLHLLYRGAVVDLIAFRHEAFNAEVLASAREVPELGGIRFIRPELLLVTHLLRPGPEAALAATELAVARRARGDFDSGYAQRWAETVGRADAFGRALARAEDLERSG